MRSSCSGDCHAFRSSEGRKRREERKKGNKKIQKEGMKKGIKCRTEGGKRERRMKNRKIVGDTGEVITFLNVKS